jgi:hypothetical protein
MQAKWGPRLHYETVTPANDLGVWNCKWALKKNKDTKVDAKRSTMFPEEWTKDDLKDELLASTVTSGKLTLPSGIELHKAATHFTRKYDDCGCSFSSWPMRSMMQDRGMELREAARVDEPTGRAERRGAEAPAELAPSLTGSREDCDDAQTCTEAAGTQPRNPK